MSTARDMNRSSSWAEGCVQPFANIALTAQAPSRTRRVRREVQDFVWVVSMTLYSVFGSWLAGWQGLKGRWADFAVGLLNIARPSANSLPEATRAAGGVRRLARDNRL